MNEGQLDALIRYLDERERLNRIHENDHRAREHATRDVRVAEVELREMIRAAEAVADRERG